jgi:hypothetical protein
MISDRKVRYSDYLSGASVVGVGRMDTVLTL